MPGMFKRLFQREQDQGFGMPNMGMNMLEGGMPNDMSMGGWKPVNNSPGIAGERAKTIPKGENDAAIMESYQRKGYKVIDMGDHIRVEPNDNFSAEDPQIPAGFQRGGFSKF